MAINVDILYKKTSGWFPAVYGIFLTRRWEFIHTLKRHHVGGDRTRYFSEVVCLWCIFITRCSAQIQTCLIRHQDISQLIFGATNLNISNISNKTSGMFLANNTKYIRCCCHNEPLADFQLCGYPMTTGRCLRQRHQISWQDETFSRRVCVDKMIHF